MLQKLQFLIRFLILNELIALEEALEVLDLENASNDENANLNNKRQGQR